MKYFIGFILSFLIYITQKTYFPSLSLNAFSPLMGIYILTFKKDNALWLAFLMGLIMDLFTSSKMGLWSLNFCLSALIIFRFKANFYKDKPQHIIFFTIIFSMLSTILYFLLAFLFDKEFSFSAKWLVTDCIVMPIVDGLYAFVCFIIPYYILINIKQKLTFLKGRKH